MSLQQAYEKTLQTTSCFISQYSQVERKKVKWCDILHKGEMRQKIGEIQIIKDAFWSLNLSMVVYSWYLESEAVKQY